MDCIWSWTIVNYRLWIDGIQIGLSLWIAIEDVNLIVDFTSLLQAREMQPIFQLQVGVEPYSKWHYYQH